MSASSPAVMEENERTLAEKSISTPGSLSKDLAPGNWTGDGTDMLYSSLEERDREKSVSAGGDHNVSHSSGLESKTASQDLGAVPHIRSGEVVKALHGNSLITDTSDILTTERNASDEHDLATEAVGGAWVGDGPAAVTSRIDMDHDHTLSPPPTASEENILYTPTPTHYYDYNYKQLENREGVKALQGKYLGGVDMFSSDAPSIIGRTGPSNTNEDVNSGAALVKENHIHSTIGQTKQSCADNQNIEKESNIYSAMPALREQAAHVFRQQAKDSLQKQARHYGGIAADDFQQTREDLRVRLGEPANIWFTQDPRSFGSRLELLQEECIQASELINTIRIDAALLVDLFEQADNISSSIFKAVQLDTDDSHPSRTHSPGGESLRKQFRRKWSYPSRTEMTRSQASDSDDAPEFKDVSITTDENDVRDKPGESVWTFKSFVEVLAWFFSVVLLYSLYYLLIETYYH